MEVSKPKASQHESYSVFTIISLIVPFIGIILGVVYLTKKDPLDRKLGEHALAFGILSIILWSTVYYWVGGMQYRAVINNIPTTYETTSSQPASPPWDADAAFGKLKEGMTRAQANQAMSKVPTSCTETETAGVGKTEFCMYGSTSDKAIIAITFVNDKLSTKTKSAY